MAELEDPHGSHAAISDVCRQLGIRLVAVDCDLYGVAPVTLAEVADLDFNESTAVLVKGSRVAGLERVVALLTAD